MIHGREKAVRAVAAVQPVSHLLAGDSEMPRYPCRNKIFPGIGGAKLTGFRGDTLRGTSLSDYFTSSPAAGRGPLRRGPAAGHAAAGVAEAAARLNLDALAEVAVHRRVQRVPAAVAAEVMLVQL